MDTTGTTMFLPAEDNECLLALINDRRGRILGMASDATARQRAVAFQATAIAQALLAYAAELRDLPLIGNVAPVSPLADPRVGQDLVDADEDARASRRAYNWETAELNSLIGSLRYDADRRAERAASR